MKRFLLFLLLTLGLASVTFAQSAAGVETDYGASVGTFAGFAGVVVLLTEGLKEVFPKMHGFLTQSVSWCVALVCVMLLWWLDAGFVAGEKWYIALLYGFGASLSANGIADTGLVQWLIGLVRKKGRKQF